MHYHQYRNKAHSIIGFSSLLVIVFKTSFANQIKALFVSVVVVGVSLVFLLLLSLSCSRIGSASKQVLHNYEWGIKSFLEWWHFIVIIISLFVQKLLSSTTILIYFMYTSCIIDCKWVDSFLYRWSVQVISNGWCHCKQTLWLNTYCNAENL